MNDREKVVKGLAHCTRPTEYGKGGNHCMDCPYTEAIGFNQFKCNGQQMMKDALAMLKEQEHKDKMYHALEDDWKRLKELLKKQEVVRCKDCKHGDICKDETGQDIVECFKQYKAMKIDWFCADGERKEGR